jgi:hypothetical protein
MASSARHETFRQIAVRAARLAVKAHAAGATDLEALERESEITPILRAPTLTSAVRSRAGENGDLQSALLTSR